MITQPKSRPADATVGEILDDFDYDHVHMVLLVEGDTLRGTLERHDLPPGGTPHVVGAGWTGRRWSWPR